MLIPKSFENLVKNFQILPGVGEKTAERFVYSIETSENDEVENLAKAILDFKHTIKRCTICNSISDEDICQICSSKTRNNDIICVIEDSKTMFSIEKSNKYNGKYFILNGLISPINGFNPEDLNIANLIKIVKPNDEIILALNSSIEGGITSMYIQKKLENYNVKISRLSYGLPIGNDIEYIDPILISKALDDRKIIS